MTNSLYFAGAYIIFFALLTAQIRKDELIKKSPINPLWLAALVGGAFLVRLMLCTYMRGFSFDMDCFSVWSDNLYKGGMHNFYYSGEFADYPPGYMIVLWILGAIKSAFSLDGDSVIALLKLPAMVSDVVLGAIIYIIAHKKINEKAATAIFLIFVFNPAVFVDSVLWGQVDSILALFLVLAFYSVTRDKLLQAAIFYTIAVLMKPQGLLFGPVLLLVFIEKKDWRLMTRSALASAGIIVGASIPFSNAWNDIFSNGITFGSILRLFDVSKIISVYAGSLASYPHPTVNAYNLYMLRGANWGTLTDPFLYADYNFWGNAVILLSLLCAGYLFFKAKNMPDRVFASSFCIISILFAFGTKVHERYLFPGLVLMLLIYIFTQNKKVLWLFGALSIANFFNVAHVLSDNGSNINWDAVTVSTSIAQVALIFASVILVLRMYTGDKKEVCIGLKRPFKTTVQGFFLPRNDIIKLARMTKKDYIIIAVIVAAYSSIAFFNLGDITAPQTFYSPLSENDTFTITLEDPQDISLITFYSGVSSVDEPLPRARLDYSSDGTNWLPLEYGDLAFSSVFSWRRSDFEPTQMKYIKGTCTDLYFRIGEICLWTTDGNLAKIASVTGNSPTVSALCDEQQYAVKTPSYMNSTYFDEIYHPRTAYENLHGINVYETTHPPLGKLFIAIGIKLFGMTPFGWRFIGTLFGIMMLPLFYLLLKRIFGRTKYALIGTLLFTFDFMHFSLTRMATIDSYPVFFIIAMYYFMYRFGQLAIYHTTMDKDIFKSKRAILSMLGNLALSGIMFGMGAASKWISIYAGAGLLVLFVLIMVWMFISIPRHLRQPYIWFLIKTIVCCALFFILLPAAIYTLSYIPYLFTPQHNDESLLNVVLDNQEYMLWYHSTLKEGHPYSSAWWQWPIVYRPLWAYSGAHLKEGFISSISIMGNPIIWWTGILGFFYGAYQGIRRRSKTVLFIGIGLMSQLLPWMAVNRTVFIYHFFASVPFMIMFIVYAIRELEVKYVGNKLIKYLIWGYCGLCFIQFILFYPVLSGMEVPTAYITQFLEWFSSWVFFV